MLTKEALQQYPQLARVDADILKSWEDAWGPDPKGWDVAAIATTQLIRELQKLNAALAARSGLMHLSPFPPDSQSSTIIHGNN